VLGAQAASTNILTPKGEQTLRDTFYKHFTSWGEEIIGKLQSSLHLRYLTSSTKCLTMASSRPGGWRK